MSTTEMLSVLVPLIGKYVVITVYDNNTGGNNLTFSGHVTSVYSEDTGSGFTCYIASSDGQVLPIGGTAWIDLVQFKVSE